jgi:hypothetical protein
MILMNTRSVAASVLLPLILATSFGCYQSSPLAAGPQQFAQQLGTNGQQRPPVQSARVAPTNGAVPSGLSAGYSTGPQASQKPTAAAVPIQVARPNPVVSRGPPPSDLQAAGPTVRNERYPATDDSGQKFALASKFVDQMNRNNAGRPSESNGINVNSNQVNFKVGNNKNVNVHSIRSNFAPDNSQTKADNLNVANLGGHDGNSRPVGVHETEPQEKKKEATPEQRKLKKKLLELAEKVTSAPVLKYNPATRTLEPVEQDPTAKQKLQDAIKALNARKLPTERLKEALGLDEERGDDGLSAAPDEQRDEQWPRYPVGQEERPELGSQEVPEQDSEQFRMYPSQLEFDGQDDGPAYEEPVEYASGHYESGPYDQDSEPSESENDYEPAQREKRRYPDRSRSGDPSSYVMPENEEYQEGPAEFDDGLREVRELLGDRLDRVSDMLYFRPEFLNQLLQLDDSQLSPLETEFKRMILCNSDEQFCNRDLTNCPLSADELPSGLEHQPDEYYGPEHGAGSHENDKQPVYEEHPDEYTGSHENDGDDSGHHFDNHNNPPASQVRPDSPAAIFFGQPQPTETFFKRRSTGRPGSYKKSNTRAFYLFDQTHESASPYGHDNAHGKPKRSSFYRTVVEESGAPPMGHTYEQHSSGYDQQQPASGGAYAMAWNVPKQAPFGQQTSSSNNNHFHQARPSVASRLPAHSGAGSQEPAVVRQSFGSSRSEARPVPAPAGPRQAFRPADRDTVSSQFRQQRPGPPAFSGQATHSRPAQASQGQEPQQAQRQQPLLSMPDNLANSATRSFDVLKAPMVPARTAPPQQHQQQQQRPSVPASFGSRY